MRRSLSLLASALLVLALGAPAVAADGDDGSEGFTIKDPGITESSGLAASRQQLQHVHGIGEEVAEEITSWEKDIDLAGEMKRIEELHCTILTQDDEQYPPTLKEIYEPPIVLYVKG